MQIWKILFNLFRLFVCMWPVTEMVWSATLVALFNTDSEPKTNSTCLSRYQEIIAVYILLLDTLLFRCSRLRDNKLNIRREISYQGALKYDSLFIEWGKNSPVCRTASIQNPLKVTIFKEFQCVTVARSLSDRFSHSPAIIDCWPQKRLLMNVKPSNLLISAPAKIP